jgi:hypothetical protein
LFVVRYAKDCNGDDDSDDKSKRKFAVAPVEVLVITIDIPFVGTKAPEGLIEYPDVRLTVGVRDVPDCITVWGSRTVIELPESAAV